MVALLLPDSVFLAVECLSPPPLYDQSS